MEEPLYCKEIIIQNFFCLSKIDPDRDGVSEMGLLFNPRGEKVAQYCFLVRGVIVAISEGMW